MAAIARKIYLNKNSGVGQLAKVNHYSAACQRVIAFERHLRTLAETPSSGIRQQRAQGRQGDFSTFLLEALSGIVSTQRSTPFLQPNRFLGASRSPIRKVGRSSTPCICGGIALTSKQALQALEKLKYVEKSAEGYACSFWLERAPGSCSLSFSGIRKMTTNGQKAMDTIAKVTSLIALFIPLQLNTFLIRALNSPSKALLAPSRLL